MPKQPSIPQDAIALADELRLALRLLVRKLRTEDDGDTSGLSLIQKLLLTSIEQQPGIGVAELARQEKLRSPTMSSHVKTLEQAGLIRRDTPDPDDRRRVGLRLTEQGQAMLDELRARRRDWLARRLTELPPEGRAALQAAVGYLAEIGQ